MKYVRQEIADFTASTVPEDWPDWDSTFTYQTDDIPPYAGGDGGSIVRYGNYYYRTLVNDNTSGVDHDTPQNTLGSKWMIWAYSNHSAMIDLQATTYTTIKHLGDHATPPTVDNDGDPLVVGYIYYDTVLLNTYLWEGSAWAITTFNGDLVVEFLLNDIDTLAMGYYTADSVTIENLDSLGAVIPSTVQVIEQSVNEDVEDYYSYMYSQYTISVDIGVMVNIPRFGEKIRVTFALESSTSSSACGYLVGGSAVDMGDTLYGVNFNFSSYSTKSTDLFGVTTIDRRGVQDLVDFETIIDSGLVMSAKRKIKSIYDEVVVFILDPTTDSKYENMMTLGAVDDASSVLDNGVQAVIAWSVQEIL